MKRIKIVVLSIFTVTLVFMCISVTFSASAETGKCGANLTYEFDSYDGTITIEGTGRMYDYTTESDVPWHSYEVREVIVKDGVEYIGKYAFGSSYANGGYHTRNLNKVTLPDSVIEIGASAFSHCFNIETFNFPKNLVKIGNNAFSSSNMTDWTLPEGLQTIGANAFSNTNITMLEVPDTVTSIGMEAFNNCDQLADIKLSNNITEISNSLFSHCTSLTKIEIPEGVTKIGNLAFFGCSDLKKIVIPDSVEDIGNTIFIQFYGVSELTIPGLNTLDDFWGDSGVPDSLLTVNITSGEIPRIFARGCTSITKVNIGNKVTSIGDKAFYDCIGLREVTIEGEIDNIPSEAFCNCSTLGTISIPESITSVSTNAFNSCTRLKDMYYGGSRYEWRAMQIASGNDAVTSANIHYAKAEPMAYRIAGISMDGELKVNLTKDYPCDGPMIVAVYASNGALIEIKRITVDMQTGETKQLPVEISADDAVSVSAFIWDTFDSMIPASNKAYKDLI